MAAETRVVGIFSPGQEGTLGHLMLSSHTSKETLQGLVLVGEARVAGELRTMPTKNILFMEKVKQCDSKL